MRRRKRTFETSWHDAPAPPAGSSGGGGGGGGSRPGKLAERPLGTSTKALLDEVAAAAASVGDAQKTTASSRSPNAAEAAAKGPSRPTRKRILLPDALQPSEPRSLSLLDVAQHTVQVRRDTTPELTQDPLKNANDESKGAADRRRPRLATVAQIVSIARAGAVRTAAGAESPKPKPPPKPRPLARQRTELMIRAAVKELAETPHTTRRLTIEKRASALLEALHKSGGSKMLHELATQQTTLVTLQQPGSVASTTCGAPDAVREEGAVSKASTLSDFGSLSLEAPNAARNRDIARTPGSARNSGNEKLDGEEAPAGPRRSLHEARARVVRKLRLVGRMAVVMRNYRQEAEEKLRRQRIESRWNIVRQIAKASLAVLHMRKGVTDAATSGTWFEDFPTLRKYLVVAPNKRPDAAVRQITEELGRIRAFTDFSIGESARRRIARSAELEVCPAGQALFRQNDEGGYFYVILTGKISIQVRDKDPPLRAGGSRDGKPGSNRAFRSRAGSSRASSAGSSRRSSQVSRRGSAPWRASDACDPADEPLRTTQTPASRPRSRRVAMQDEGTSSSAAQRGHVRNASAGPEHSRRAGDGDYLEARRSNEVKVQSKRAPLDTRIFGAARAAELSRQAAAHQGREKKEPSFTEVAVLKAGQSFGGLGLRTVALGKRKASAIAAEYTELLRIEAVDYREVFMAHEMERITRPVQFFKGLPEFAMLTDEELTQIAYGVRIARFASGSVIFRQGHVVEDSFHFGIVKIGRCSRFKTVHRDGSEPTPEEIDRNIKGSKNQSEEETDQRDCTKIASSSRSPAGGQTLCEYALSALGPGGLLVDKAVLLAGPGTSLAYSFTVVAETCAEVYFVPRSALAFALRNGGKFRKLVRQLPPALSNAKLRDLLQQRDLWNRFQQRFVSETLNESPRGRIIKDAMQRTKAAEARAALLHRHAHERIEDAEPRE